MNNQDYILDVYQYRALIALRDFVENAFCGYQDGYGREEEMAVADTFCFLVRDYVNLIDASKQTVDDYNERHQHYQSIMKPQI